LYFWICFFCFLFSLSIRQRCSQRTL
jgi:hypothetical protein